VPRRLHAEWSPPPSRPDPISLLEKQAVDRVPELLPIRYGRMLSSPFAFLRGAAAVMASDLSFGPRTGITVQLTGDAHVANFGFYGSTERQLLFDINDFDETLPGPWEWDVKRLAASVAVAGRSNGFSRDDGRDAVLEVVRSYHSKMAEFAQLSNLEIWYSHVTAESFARLLAGTARRREFEAKAGKARSRGSAHAFSRMTEVVDGRRRIVENPPLVERLPEEEVQAIINPIFRKYLDSLQDDRKHLLEQFQYVDSARRVVGVGSVGTRCYMVALTGRDETDALVLQLKEATPSVLAEFLPPTVYRNQAQRIVNGQRLVQAASDIFLGWLRHSNGREFYWRQLRDMKASVDIQRMSPSELRLYGGVCSSLLARAHARSGDAVQIGA
jgi:uncharacterized protein (DUF2252 family)